MAKSRTPVMPPPGRVNNENPFKPGAGHSPPHLAGREDEIAQFGKLLEQRLIILNVVLTGLRGVGKTVLMDDVYKPLAIEKNWVWVGSDFSESAFVDEYSLCLRLLTDLSLFTSELTVKVSARVLGLKSDAIHEERLTFDFLTDYFERQNGLVADKLQNTLELCWSAIEKSGKNGILFAYDEAQVVQDRREKDQYPLAAMLQVFQSVQRKGMRYMLLLTGLPTLFPKLVESRTYAERMFVVQEIGKLSRKSCLAAIEKPLESNLIKFTPASIEAIVDESKCYPYFIQYICREAYDYFKTWYVQRPNHPIAPIPIKTLVRKLESDFFAGRWSRATDRQRELLLCVSHLAHAAEEFTVNEIATTSKSVATAFNFKPFKKGDIGQLLPKLVESGFIYKTRHGKYSLAVPLFDEFIKRQFELKQKNEPSLF